MGCSCRRYKGECTTGTAATITIVNHKPNVEKDVKDRTDGTWGKDSDYSVGDEIPYRVTVDVPENIAESENLYINGYTYKSGISVRYIKNLFG